MEFSISRMLHFWKRIWKLKKRRFERWFPFPNGSLSSSICPPFSPGASQSSSQNSGAFLTWTAVLFGALQWLCASLSMDGLERCRLHKLEIRDLQPWLCQVLNQKVSPQTCGNLRNSGEIQGFLRMNIIISFPKNCLACRFPGMSGMFWTFGFFGGRKRSFSSGGGGTWRCEREIRGKLPTHKQKTWNAPFLKKVDFNPWKIVFPPRKFTR